MNESDKRILLIDEQEDWLLPAALVLEKAGYKVSKAHDFEEAKGILREEGNCFDLIIADQLLAKRAIDMFCDLIWVKPGKRRRVIVLFVTEPTLPKAREIFNLGVYDCETKQDNPEAIVHLVQDALEKPRDC